MPSALEEKANEGQKVVRDGREESGRVLFERRQITWKCNH
jgi:hypothetical protein